MDKKFLLKYLNTDSPSTLEIETQKMWLNELEKLVDDVIIDNYGNIALLIKGTEHKEDGENFKVVIDAHADEIGWTVKSIEDDGFIKVHRNGGTDNDITQGMSVKIITKNGKIKGFFGSPAIHLKDSDNDRKIKIEDLTVDVGAFTSKEVKKMGICVGDFIVVDRQAEFFNKKMIVGKALDDKIGGFIHSEVIKELKEKNIKLPYDLYIVNSVQEEVGLVGARMITNTIKPNVAICFDVTFDTSTATINKSKHGNYKIGEGLVFRHGYDVHNNLFNLMKDVADKNKIDYKVQVGGSGGTNTYGYFLSNGGVVASTISIPLRYMHTQNEVVKLSDVKTAVKFYIKLLQEIKNNHEFKYF